MEKQIVKLSKESIYNIRFIIVKVIIQSLFKIMWYLGVAALIIMIARKSPDWDARLVYALFILMLSMIVFAGLQLCKIAVLWYLLRHVQKIPLYTFTQDNPPLGLRYKDYLQLVNKMEESKVYRFHYIKFGGFYHYLYKLEEENAV